MCLQSAILNKTLHSYTHTTAIYPIQWPKNNGTPIYVWCRLLKQTNLHNFWQTSKIFHPAHIFYKPIFIKFTQGNCRQQLLPPPQCCHLLILSLILAQLGKNMTSYNKPYNKRTMPHCRQKRTKPWPQLPCKKIS